MDEPFDITDRLTQSHRAEIRRLIHALAAAEVAGRSRLALVERLGTRIAALNTLANLSGRAAVLREADKILPGRERVDLGGVPPAGTALPASTGGGLPRVTFDEAVTAVVSREPRLAAPIAGEPRYEAVQRIYREGGFSAAKAVDQNTVERVQIEMARGLQQGRTLPQMREDIQGVVGEMGDWTDAYTDNVIRTNTTGAQAEGIRDQMREPAVARVIPAMRYVATLDGDGRPNHVAAHGMILPPDHPLLAKWTPPNGYQCRCGWAMVNRNQLRRLDLLNDDGTARAWIPPKVASGEAQPDPGFG